jgi:hypothetical protein
VGSRPAPAPAPAPCHVGVAQEHSDEAVVADGARRFCGPHPARAARPASAAGRAAGGMDAVAALQQQEHTEGTQAEHEQPALHRQGTQELPLDQSAAQSTPCVACGGDAPKRRRCAHLCAARVPQLPKARDLSKRDQEKLQRELEKEQEGEETTVRPHATCEPPLRV